MPTSGGPQEEEGRGRPRAGGWGPSCHPDEIRQHNCVEFSVDGDGPALGPARRCQRGLPAPPQPERPGPVQGVPAGSPTGAGQSSADSPTPPHPLLSECQRVEDVRRADISMWERWFWGQMTRHVALVISGPESALRQSGAFGLLDWQQAFVQMGMERPEIPGHLLGQYHWHLRVGMGEC